MAPKAKAASKPPPQRTAAAGSKPRGRLGVSSPAATDPSVAALPWHAIPIKTCVLAVAAQGPFLPNQGEDSTGGAESGEDLQNAQSPSLPDCTELLLDAAEAGEKLSDNVGSAVDTQWRPQPPVCAFCLNFESDAVGVPESIARAALDAKTLLRLRARGLACWSFFPTSCLPTDDAKAL